MLSSYYTNNSSAFALELSDNTSTSEAETVNLDLSGYARVVFDYWYAERDMDG